MSYLMRTYLQIQVNVSNLFLKALILNPRIPEFKNAFLRLFLRSLLAASMTSLTWINTKIQLTSDAIDRLTGSDLKCFGCQVDSPLNKSQDLKRRYFNENFTI